MRALLIDLDGVLYVGDQLLPGAVEAITWLRKQAIPHRFLTNTTSRPRADLVEKLHRIGLPVEAEEIITPPIAARRWLASKGRSRVALFVPEATKTDFSGLDELPEGADAGAEAVILGDLGEGWDFVRLNHAFRLLMADPATALLALGMTRYWRAPDGLRLDTAPFVAALREAAGVEPVVLGKPAPEFFGAALSDLGVQAEETLMIGDDIRSDVDGAQQAGLRGVLVRTGKYMPTDLDGTVHPYAVMDSIADLQPCWEAWSQRSKPGADAGHH